MDGRNPKMKLEDYINQLKKDYPTLKRGEDDAVVTLSDSEYNQKITEWANNLLLEEQEESEKKAAALQAEADKAALLAKLGITADEAKLLLL
jgi:2',3'-cyclic-nucleotide 2'-phosphodiesterase (5'-nucleotidase family)